MSSVFWSDPGEAGGEVSGNRTLLYEITIGLYGPDMGVSELDVLVEHFEDDLRGLKEEYERSYDGLKIELECS